MTEPRTTVYRGASRSEVERAYHAGARAAVDEGYVPAGEEWSTALGQEVLTVRYVYDPDQGAAVLDALTAAERESRLAEMAPPVARLTPAVALPSQPPGESGLIGVIRWIWAVASLAGFVWLWVNTGGDVATKVILVGMLGVLWIGIVSAVIGVIALLLGMVGLVVHPFRRR